MQNVGDFLQNCADLLASPWGRVIGIMMSAASLGFSIWALKTTSFYKSSFKAEHERFLETLWQDTYKLVLTNDKAAERVAKIFGRPVEETKDEASILMFINILCSSFNASRRNVVHRDLHDLHMRSVFDHLDIDPNGLLNRLKSLGYHADFLEECSRYIVLAKKQNQNG